MNTGIKILLISLFLLPAGSDQNRISASYYKPGNGCDLYISDISVHNVTCFGGNDGSITLIIEGGSGQYEISLDSLTWADDLSIEGLMAGEYIVYIRDRQLSCAIQTDPIEIEQRKPIEEFREVAICEGDSILLAGKYRKEPGEFIDSLHNRIGCDSVVFYELTLKDRPPLDLGPDEMDVCYGDQLEFDVSNPAIKSYYFSNQIDLGFEPVFEFTYSEFQAPAYLYAEVTGKNGCTSEDYLYFRNNSIQEFGISYIDQTQDPSIGFKGYVQDNADSWHWLIDGEVNIPDILEGSYEFAENGEHEICFFAENDCGTRNKCVLVSVTKARSATAVTDIETALKIYPNPTQGLLKIEGIAVSASIRIYNLEGKVLLNSAIKSEKTTLNLGHWDAGVYLIEVSFREEIIREKLIIY